MSDRPAPNAMSRSLSRLRHVPAPLRARLQTLMLGRLVPFLGTAGLHFDEVSEARIVVRVANRRRVRNHIGGVHAAAMALLAETATGFAVGLTLPDESLPLLKAMKVEYVKRAQGGLRAVAALRPEQVATMQREPKGEVVVPVTITDEQGEEPIKAEMLWAWVPKKKG